ncbi:RNA polymerase sigma factor [Solimonas soli]|uniref:RNA polymerase sigma factor n=1 Tax=Solimonas soli TaxID=413479 RepID=UPI0004B26221|nr:RNA polymerase sigma factor [Solimonas soli]
MTIRRGTATAPPTLLSSLLSHYDELVDELRRRFGDRAFAREVVHDVCVQILEKPQREAHTPLALLRRISHDAAVDRCRADDRRRRWIDSVAELPDVACAAATQEQAVDAEQELQRLERAIAALPPRRRDVFVMHKIHELPQAEVAARLGISLKMVEKQMRLGMLACRAALARPDDRHD